MSKLLQKGNFFFCSKIVLYIYIYINDKINDETKFPSLIVPCFRNHQTVDIVMKDIPYIQDANSKCRHENKFYLSNFYNLVFNHFSVRS